MKSERESCRVCDSDFMSDEKKFWTSIIVGLTHDDSKYKTVLGTLSALKTKYIGFQRFGYLELNKTGEKTRCQIYTNKKNEERRRIPLYR